MDYMMPSGKRKLTSQEHLTSIRKNNETQGRLVIDTHHSIERFIERYQGRKITFNNTQVPLDYGFIMGRIEAGMKKIINRHNDLFGVYLIHSIESKVGVVIGWRRQGDPSLDDGRNHAVIITLLPLASSHVPRDVTDKMVLVQQLNRLSRDILSEQKKEIRNSVGTVDFIKFKEFDSESDFYITIYEGKVWNHTGVEVEVP